MNTLKQNPIWRTFQTFRQRASQLYVAGAELNNAVHACQQFAQQGLSSTVAYWNYENEDVQAVAENYRRAIQVLAAEQRHVVTHPVGHRAVGRPTGGHAVAAINVTWPSRRVSVDDVVSRHLPTLQSIADKYKVSPFVIIDSEYNQLLNANPSTLLRDQPCVDAKFVVGDPESRAPPRRKAGQQAEQHDAAGDEGRGALLDDDLHRGGQALGRGGGGFERAAALLADLPAGLRQGGGHPVGRVARQLTLKSTETPAVRALGPWAAFGICERG